ncbi:MULTISPECIES: hypothetical protein [unclassified Leptolyngbya]|uniref:hypothetical protein n=1 Tax=unclassified Leptolyngbya TaxID=2650499 RepID=UPI003D3182A7
MFIVKVDLLPLNRNVIRILTDRTSPHRDRSSTPHKNHRIYGSIISVQLTFTRMNDPELQI